MFELTSDPEKGTNTFVPPEPNVGGVPARVNDGKSHFKEAVPADFIFGWPPKVDIEAPEPELPGICGFQLLLTGPLKLTVPKSLVVLGAGLNNVPIGTAVGIKDALLGEDGFLYVVDIVVALVVVTPDDR